MILCTDVCVCQAVAVEALQPEAANCSGASCALPTHVPLSVQAQQCDRAAASPADQVPTAARPATRTAARTAACTAAGTPTATCRPAATAAAAAAAGAPRRTAPHPPALRPLARARATRTMAAPSRHPSPKQGPSGARTPPSSWRRPSQARACTASVHSTTHRRTRAVRRRGRRAAAAAHRHPQAGACWRGATSCSLLIARQDVRTLTLA